MTLETFFEKFELFADAPDAVARMREVVLEMAVRGKLSEGRADDAGHPAWLELLQRLESDSDAAFSTTEPPFEIPQSWRWTKLGRIGNTRPRNDAPDKARCSFVPMTLIPAEYGKCPRFEERSWGEIEKGYTHFKDGDVVMAKITPCFENGKSAVINGLAGGFGAGTTELHVFRRSSEAVVPEFVLIFLKTRGFIVRGIPSMTGSAGQKRVPSGYFAESPFPLPPPAEQKRIVAKVDELMALCDRLEAQQQELETRHAALSRAALSRFAEAPTPSNLNLLFHRSYDIAPADLRKTILTLAVQGKLVPQDPNDEPAEELYARVAKIRQAMKAKQFEPVPADEMPYEVPFTWAWVRLGNISLKSDSGWSPQCLPEARTATNWGVLKVSAVSWGVFKPDENKALPPGMTGRPDSEVMAGDFLLSRANTEELVARSVVVHQTPPRLMMCDKIVRFTFPNEVERTYINLANNSDSARTYYARHASGTSSSMKNVGREVMCNLPIPLPPLAEQRRIVAKVNQLMAMVDTLEAQLAASGATADNLLSALVAELT